MNSLELRIPPVAVVIIFAALMASVAVIVPAVIEIPARRPIAGALVLAGALVAVAGVLAFRRHKTTVNPLAPEQATRLVASGIYRISRNPMYLGFLLALAGWCVYLANGFAVILLPLFVAYMNRFQIQPEERALREKFGSSFDEYARTVRRWV